MADHQRFGYFLHPAPYDPPLGYAALEVFLARHDPERYFDAAAAHFMVNNGEKTSQVAIVHPWPQAPQRYRVALGRFHLLAHNGDMVEGVSLGGVLEVETFSSHTRCLLTSSAPIFDIEESGGLISMLETEVEAELGRLRAEWQGADAAFDCRLAGLDPATLFVASLHLLDDYLHNHTQALTPDEVLAERVAVHQAIRALQRAGHWPQPAPSLRQLMLAGKDATAPASPAAAVLGGNFHRYT